MAKRKYANLHHETEVDLIPMMDLALNLTFFFVVLTTLAKDQVEQGINLPLTESATKTEEAATPDAININLDAEGQVRSWGQTIPLRGEAGKQGQELLASLIRNEAARARGPTQDKAVKTVVVLRIDENADYGEFQKVIDTCQSEGFYKFVMKSRVEVR